MKIRPDIKVRPDLKKPISYIGIKGIVTFKEISDFFKKIFKKNK